MTRTRSDLHEKLISVLRLRGSVINTENGWIWDPFSFDDDEIVDEQVYRSREKVHIYFQPPESLRIKYPCIVYDLKDIRPWYANNRKYAMFRAYELTFISKYPDSEVVDRIMSLPMCSFDRSFTAENLHHFVYTIYY